MTRLAYLLNKLQNEVCSDEQEQWIYAEIDRILNRA